MSYISTEHVAEIRNDLKTQLPDYKFKCYSENHSTIHVHILESPIDLTYNGKTWYGINVYSFKEQFKENGDLVSLFEKITSIMSKFQGKAHEDGDYGMIPTYYIDLSIGDYNRPFILVEKPKAETPGVSTEGVTIRFNTTKNGIEISFSKKPSSSILDSLKADGFRWSRFNAVWYIPDSSYNRFKAAKYGELPKDENTGDAGGGDDFDNRQIDQDAARIGA
jgi:hypothetical protein